MDMTIGSLHIGKNSPFLLIAGPCVIEDYQTTYAVASFLQDVTRSLDIPFVFKASYDKANRTSIHSYRGPGMKSGLEILARIKSELGIHVLSDVHQTSEIAAAASILDIIQIPAFLCRQTDFLLAVSSSGKPVNIKKGQFLAPMDMANVVEKVKTTGNRNILLTERGSMFGYNNLVVDFRGIAIMQRTGCPVIFDATHSVQLPGGQGGSSGGQREFAPYLARAAIAAGADGLFFEVHPDPDHARCDGPNSLKTDNNFKMLLKQLKRIQQALAVDVPA